MRFIPRVVRRGLLENALKRLPVDRNNRWLNLTRLARGYLSAADLPIEEQYGRYTRVFDNAVIRELAPSAAAVPDYYQQIFEECDSVDLLDKMMYFDLKTSLPEQLLMLTDKMTMAVSLEARVPFLDHRVVEFAARVPGNLKVKGMGLRYLQKKTFRGRLPDYVYQQRKKGFGAPVGAWLRDDLRDLTAELLGESRLKTQGIFDAKSVARLLSDHHAQRADHSDQILALVVFQLWFRSYGLG